MGFFKVLCIQSLSSAVRPCCVVIGSLGKRQNEWKIVHSTHLYLIIAKFLLEYPLGASVEERFTLRVKVIFRLKFF